MRSAQESLIIKRTQASAKVLTNEQKKFNKFVRKVAKFKREIEEKEQVLEKALDKYYGQIKPLETEAAKSQMLLAEKFYHLLKKFKYTPKEEEEIKVYIVEFLDSAFSEINANEYQKQIYNDCVPEGSCEINAEKRYKEQVNEFINTMFLQFGIKLKPDEIPDMRDATEDDILELQASLKARMIAEQEQEELRELRQESKRKKTATQIKKEQKARARKQKQAEQEKVEKALKDKTFRSLYVPLKAALQSDTRGTKEEQSLRKELMEEVSVAYKEGDMLRLLELEVLCLNTEERIANASDEELKQYCAVLEEQEHDLHEQQLVGFMHERYIPIDECIHLPTHAISSFMEQERMDVKEVLDRLNGYQETVTNKKTLLNFLKNNDCCEDEAYYPFFEDDDEYFF